METNDIVPTDFSPRELEIQVDRYRIELSNMATADDLCQLINKNFTEFLDNYIKLGEAGVGSENSAFIYAFSFVLPERIKDYAILHRDVLFELIKGALRVEDNVLSQDAQTAHFEQSKTVLLGATTELEAQISQVFNTLPSAQKLKRSLSLLQSPREVYQVQIQTIIEQIAMIQDAKEKLLETINVFEEIQRFITSSTDGVEQIYQKILDSITQLLQEVQNNPSKKDLKQFIDNQLLAIPTSSSKLKGFNDEVKLKISVLPHITLPIGTMDGVLEVRSEDLSEKIQLWMDYRILPFLVDLWALEDKLMFNMKKTYRHLLEILEKGATESEFYPIFVRDLKVLKRKQQKAQPPLKKYVKEIDILDDELLVSNLFKRKEFLAVPFQNNLPLSKDAFAKPIRTAFTKISNFFNLGDKYKQNLTPIELSAQCMAHRMYQESDGHYDALFLNKRFIGDLFLVPREIQEQKIIVAINQWKGGFDKAVLVTGERLSGKSTFLNYTASKFFGKDIVLLNPNSDVTIDGRKFKTTKDLKEALVYINANNARSTQPVIIIDNIELWRDEKYTLVSNVRALIDFIETVKGRAFVVVSTTPILKAHLDSRLNFTNVFNTLINVDSAKKEELEEIFLLRHGTSHRVVVDESCEPIATERLKSLILGVGRKAHFNIGLALQSWTHHITFKEENKIQFSKADFAFYDFFSKEEVIILKHTLLYRQITFFELKQIATSSYEARYRSAIRRLINTKIILREGSLLVINPVVLGDVLEILKQKAVLPIT